MFDNKKVSTKLNCKNSTRFHFTEQTTATGEQRGLLARRVSIMAASFVSAENSKRDGGTFKCS